MHNIKWMGPNIEPCGTLHLFFLSEEEHICIDSDQIAI